MTAFQKLACMPSFELHVMRVGARMQAHFFQLLLLLILTLLFLTLLLLVTQLPVVDDFAHRRFGLRCNLDKVELTFTRNFQRFLRGHNPDHPTIFIQNPNLRDSDSLIKSYLGAFLSYWCSSFQLTSLGLFLSLIKAGSINQGSQQDHYGCCNLQRYGIEDNILKFHIVKLKYDILRDTRYKNSMNSEQNLLVTAPAKLNLGLEVLRRRSDGFHDLNTIFAEIDLCDSISLHPDNSGKVSLQILGNTSLGDEPPETNLCVRAVHAAARLIGSDMLPSGVRILLTKSIPTGAGLGGGSSDAAATLIGVLRLWGVEPGTIRREHLIAEAAALGSDVPFFLDGGVAIAGSRGEELTQLDLRLPWHILLVHPGLHISTAAAYGAVNRTDEREATDLVSALRSGLADPSTLSDLLSNDFESPIFSMHPELREIRRKLIETGAFFARMSGSGSSIFGLFHHRQEASAAMEAFPDLRSDLCHFAD